MILAYGWPGWVASRRPTHRAHPGAGQRHQHLHPGLDLALFEPLCMLAGVLLLQRGARDFLLASVGVLEFLTIGLAVSLMGLNMARVGAASSMVEWVVFPGMPLAGLVIAVALLMEKSILGRTIELATSAAQVCSCRVARAELSNQALEPSHHSLLSNVNRMDVAPRRSPASVHPI
jgi:hypothetical protein